MIGKLGGSVPSISCSECTFNEAAALENNLITGDVELQVVVGESAINNVRNQGSSITFSNITDSAGEAYDGWTWDNLFFNSQALYGQRDLEYDEKEYWLEFTGGNSKEGGIEGMFYGPSFEEVGGLFSRRIDGEDMNTHPVAHLHEWINGAFDAKRQ